MNIAETIPRLNATRYVPKGVRGRVGSPFEDVTPNADILCVWRWIKGV